jgi:type I restriction enzyme S subunit
MDGWKRKKVKHLGTVYSGSTPSTEQAEYWNGSIEWITPNDLSKNRSKYFKNSERKITQNGLKYCSAILLPAGSLVISSRAPIGYLTIPQTEFTTNQGCKSIIFNCDNDVEFQYYNFQYNVERLKQIGEGTTFSEVSKKFLENFELDSPVCKNEQKGIAIILRTVDESIAQTRVNISKYKRIKTGLLHDLLSKGIHQGLLRNKDKTDFIIKDDYLIPEDWEIKTLVATIVQLHLKKAI